MKAYWDASALVAALTEPTLRARLRSERGFTRSHSLSEAFSALTGGNIRIRVSADRASEMLDELTTDLDFVEIDAAEILKALRTARQKGVRGGRVHDYLHIIAAEKVAASESLTGDRNDFVGLSNAVTVAQI